LADQAVQVRAVVFDFGGVLCFHPQAEQIAAAAKLLGISPAKFVEAFWKPRLEYDGGLIDSREYWSRMTGFAGVPFEEALLPELIRTEIDFWSHFDRRVLDWARTLRERGVKTSVLSNLPAPLGEALRSTQGFLDTFDHHVFSYELRVVKPDREIYECTLRTIGVTGPESLFLDDRENNVDGARVAGMQAELFTTWEAFVSAGIASRYGLPEPDNLAIAPTGHTRGDSGI
jgi:putative hydrolase of the HAD superfamily